MRLSRIVRYDGVPTPAARAAAILLLVAAFASAFTAYSRGETPRRAPAADLITESGATGPAVGRRAAAPPRLAPAAGIPAMRGDRSG